MSRAPAVLALVLAVGACATEEDTTVDGLGDGHIVRRHATALVDGCTIDDAELAELRSGALGLVDDVVLLCAEVRWSGGSTPTDVRPADPPAAIAALHEAGFGARLGVRLLDGSGEPLDDYDIGRALTNVPSRSVAYDALTKLGASADGYDLDLRDTTGELRDEIGDFLEDLQRSNARGSVTLLVDPSGRFTLGDWSPFVDRVRWVPSHEASADLLPGAADANARAKQLGGSAAGDVTCALAGHDAAAVLLGLRAWEPPALAADVGLVFDGVGFEAPGTWRTLRAALR